MGIWFWATVWMFLGYLTGAGTVLAVVIVNNRKM